MYTEDVYVWVDKKLIMVSKDEIKDDYNYHVNNYLTLIIEIVILIVCENIDIIN